MDGKSSFKLSFWERESYFENVDLLIIGGGIVGLNAARAVRELKPSWKILVVDRGDFLPYGASTRNAGFACFGSMTELLDDLKVNSRSEVFGLVQRRWEGLKRLRAILKDEQIGYEELGGYEVFSHSESAIYNSCMSTADDFNKELEKITGKSNVYSEVNGRIDHFGFHQIGGMILNRCEGQLNTGAMMKALLLLVREKQIEVLNGIEVKGWVVHGDKVQVETGNGFSIPAQRVLITTNAFARQLLPELQVEPGRAQVLVTKPVNGLKMKGAFHYDRGYYYFRNVGDRILFGGGRNLNFDGERTYEFGLTDQIQQQLERLLKEMILPNDQFEVEQRWSGIMGLGPKKTTIIRKTEERIYCAVRMGGMGVAIGSLVGEEAAALLCS